MAFLWGASGGLRSAAVGMEFMTAVTGSPAVETSIVRNGDAAIRINNASTGETVQQAFRTTQGVCYIRFYFRVVAAPSSAPVDFVFVSAGAGASKVGVRMNTNLTLQFRNMEDNAQIGATSSAVSLDTWYRLEIKIDSTTLASTAVEARLYTDSVSAVVSWNPSGTIDITANPDRLYIGSLNTNTTFDVIFSDIVIYDDSGSYCNTWPGHGYLAYLFPDGAGTNAAWTRGGTDSGANWSQVEEKPPNDITDYVQSLTSGEKDSYSITTPAAIESNHVIHFIAPAARFRISNTSGGDPDFAVGIKTSGGEDITGNVSGTVGSTTWRSLQTATPSNYLPLANNSNYEQPGGTSAWTKSALDSAEILLQETVTDTHYIQVTSCWVLVGYSQPAVGTSPTVVIDTANSTEFATRQPEILFTGTDAEADDIRYNIQITDNSASFAGGDIVADALTTGSGLTVHTNPVLDEFTWEGHRQVDDRPGILFYGKGGILDSIDFNFGPHESIPADTNGSYLVRIYEAAGNPYSGLTSAWQASTSYSVGDVVRPTNIGNGYVHFRFRCKTGGTSAGSEPTWPGCGNNVDWQDTADGTEVNDNTVVWEALSGAHPANPAHPEDVPTPNWIAQSDVHTYNPGVADPGWKTIDFTGANRIRLVNGHAYFAILDWRPANFTNTNTLTVACAAQSTEAVARDMYIDAREPTNNGARVTDDVLFRVREAYVLLDKVSGTDNTFTNKDNGGDSDPFTSGDQIGYTVQAGDALSDATYWIRVRGQDPDDTTNYGSWSSTISFTVNLNIEGVLNKTLGDLTAAAAGSLSISSVLSQTLANLAAAAAGALLIQAELTKTLDNVTLTASGEEPSAIEGALSQTLENVSLASVGALQISGSLTQSLADLSAVSAGKLAIAGTLEKTLGELGVTSSGSLFLIGELSQALANIGLESSAVLALSGALDQALENASLEAAGELALVAQLDKSLDSLTLSATGAVSIEGGLQSTLEDIVLTAAGQLPISGALNSSLESATLASAGALDLAASLDQTLGDASLSAAGALPIEGALGKTLDDLSLEAAGAGQSINTGSLSATLANAALSASGALANEGALSTALEDAGLVSTGGLTIAGALSQTFASVSITATGNLPIDGSLDITLENAALEAEGVSQAHTNGVLSATLSDATLASSGSLELTGQINTTLDGLGLEASGALQNEGALSTTLDDAILEATGAFLLPISGELDQTLENVSLYANGSLLLAGELSATLSSLDLDATGELFFEWDGNVYPFDLTICQETHLADLILCRSSDIGPLVIKKVEAF